MQRRSALRGFLIGFLTMVLASPSLWGAHPLKGTPAPPLDGLKLLQAPTGAKADWASLKGKVVVLEFWATWCSPCIASLPHLNELVASLDPAKFQFINVDDEERKGVENFLTKKKMSGWVGLDSSGEVFKRYGVLSRPTTIVIDGGGRIVAATLIHSVSAADLQAVAAGRAVAFQPVMEITEESPPSAPATGSALFSVSVSRAAADAKMSRANHPPTGTDLLGQDAGSLVSDFFDTFGGERVVLKSPLPEGLYDVRVNLADGPSRANDLALRQAILAAFHLQVKTVTVTKPAYILRATDQSKKLLSPSGSTHATKRGTWDGRFLLMNGTMDDLAYVLATALENPVLDETDIAGKYDARFQIPTTDLPSLNKVLRETMGLELLLGTKVESITVQEISSQ